MRRRRSFSRANRRKKRPGFDANQYATKKTVAQGMLDIALLASNASQLKYVLQVGPIHEFYNLLVALISVSIVMQVTMGALILSLNILSAQGSFFMWHQAAAKTTDTVVVTVLLITILNVVISAFDSSLAAYLRIP